MDQKAYWKKVAGSYDKIVGETGDLAHAKIINPIVEEFFGDLSGKIVLDAGCGNGYRAAQMAKNAEKVVGVDFTDELIKYAKEKFTAPNLEFRVGDIRNLDLPDGEFDTVLCNMALIDVEGLEEGVGELARVLRIGGKLVISITHPCFENPPNTTSFENEKGEKTGRLIKNYFVTGVVKDTKEDYQHCHYTLADYLNAFARNSLFVERVAEPNTGEILGEVSSHTPYFVVCKLRKVE